MANFHFHRFSCKREIHIPLCPIGHTLMSDLGQYIQQVLKSVYNANNIKYSYCKIKYFKYNIIGHKVQTVQSAVRSIVSTVCTSCHIAASAPALPVPLALPALFCCPRPVQSCPTHSACPATACPALTRPAPLGVFPRNASSRQPPSSCAAVPPR